MHIPLKNMILAASLMLFISLPSHLFSQSKKPNVLMICIDDLNDWIRCLSGNSYVKTPHIIK